MNEPWKDMNYLWKNLEHVHPQDFTADDFLWINEVVLTGLNRCHWGVIPEFAFFRSEEYQGNPLVTQESGGKKARIPRLTVCYLRSQEWTAVGLAFCSKGDNPNKLYGKALALKRAVTALVGRQICNENYIREDTEFKTFLNTLGSPLAVKSFLIQDQEYTLVLKDGENVTTVPNKEHILNNETIMNEFWLNLEHLDPRELTRNYFKRPHILKRKNSRKEEDDHNV